MEKLFKIIFDVKKDFLGLSLLDYIEEHIKEWKPVSNSKQIEEAFVKNFKHSRVTKKEKESLSVIFSYNHGFIVVGLDPFENNGEYILFVLEMYDSFINIMNPVTGEVRQSKRAEL